MEKGLVCSKNNFYTLLRNSVYCGKIFIPAYKDEDDIHVIGKHEPIITESLFYEVQDILNGRKRKLRLKNTRKNELPLRGFLECPQCGGTLTGSASKGNGGLYYYYHCMKGCKERAKADIVNGRFINALATISANESVIDTYYEIMDDMFRSNSQFKVNALRKIHDDIGKNKERLNNAMKLRLDGEIDAQEYRGIKQEYEPALERLERQKLQISLMDADYKKYLDYDFVMLKSLHKGYEKADTEEKQQIISVIFPEKLVFENNAFRTKKINGVIETICRKIEDNGTNRKGLALKFQRQSHKVSPNDQISNQIYDDLRDLYVLKGIIKI